ncbi:hypothetical protein [Ruminococcus sp.]|uniref:hypothetical protein n=1 Tax=Ruminococcus sp. TaxID=41978 RepID=UPI0025E484EE|nr:hypothetical protein [Ruminococcus sp.]MCR4640240.1 hypothetical protein [Ruminococcus sp.]
MNGINYDAEKRARAGRGAVLRVLVAVYIAYLAFKIVSAEDTTMSAAACRVIGAVFIAADIAFIVYTYNLFRKEMKAAEADVEADEAAEGADDSEEQL